MIYLNQTAQWSPKTGELDKYGKFLRGTVQTISCRREGTYRLLRSIEGKDILAENRYFLDTLVAVGDLLDGRVVIRVDSCVGFTGSISHYEVYTT